MDCPLQIKIFGRSLGQEVYNVTIQYQADAPIGWLLGEMPNEVGQNFSLAKDLKAGLAAQVKIGDDMQLMEGLQRHGALLSEYEPELLNLFFSFDYK